MKCASWGCENEAVVYHRDDDFPDWTPVCHKCCAELSKELGSQNKLIESK